MASNSVRTFVTEVGPALHRIHDQYAENPAVGMDLVCRVLYEAQQDYFAYVVPLGNGQNPACLSFAAILSKVLTYRVASLSPLPSPWYLMAGAPKIYRQRPTGQGSEAGPRSQSGAVATFNAHPDSLLMQRFRDSEFSKISDMLSGRDVTIPKHAGKDVCLAWALKGSCSARCSRKEQHVRYGPRVLSQLHELLTTCGVANPQE